MSAASEDSGSDKLEKSLKLFDVYSMATGAMFSSGLFLLPGIAAAATGNSVYLAYLAAGFLILPAMYCMAELSTAMPKAGGTYFFLDRSMGPMMGAVGGLGSWIAVVFKSAFALVGMGAYLGIYLDVPITATAVILTLVFGAVNYVGAKETTMLQRILVTILVAILAIFVLAGLVEVGVPEILQPAAGYDFFTGGAVGFLSTIGLVFVSYAGLTKVASVAGEVENPDRNIPLGMLLSLITATTIYTLGTLILVKVLEPNDLYGSLTPIADGARVFLGWVPNDLGVIAVVVAAIAAFASTGNAGIMSASRYPYAMAKDGLLPERLSEVGRFGTPTIAIGATVVAMVAVLVLFDVQSVAKLASAFQLLLFGLVCLAVVVMRESRIESYRPGYAAPLYPWLPIAGMLIAFWLIVEMGLLAIGFTGMVVIVCVLWFQFYAAGTLKRRGAIFHVHEQLGQSRYEGIETELMSIVHERTEGDHLSYEEMVAQSEITVLRSGHRDLSGFVDEMVKVDRDHFEIGATAIRDAFAEDAFETHLIRSDVLLCYRDVDAIERPALFVFLLRDDATADMEGGDGLHTVMFLLSPSEPAGLELRLAGHLAEVVQSATFERRWGNTENARAFKQILMRDEHFLHAHVDDIPRLAGAVGGTIGDADLPGSCLIVTIERGNDLIIANRDETLRSGDMLGIIGEPEDLDALMER